jgi:hypothetical protein
MSAAEYAAAALATVGSGVLGHLFGMAKCTAAYNRGLARGTQITIETYTALTGIDLSDEGGGN